MNAPHKTYFQIDCVGITPYLLMRDAGLLVGPMNYQWNSRLAKWELLSERRHPKEWGVKWHWTKVSEDRALLRIFSGN